MNTKKLISILVISILFFSLLVSGQKFSFKKGTLINQKSVLTNYCLIDIKIRGNDSIPSVELQLDDYGNFMHGRGDTIATSCELAADMEILFRHHLTHRSELIDSAYSYRKQVEFYRKWFGQNITPDPLKRMAEKRS